MSKSRHPLRNALGALGLLLAAAAAPAATLDFSVFASGNAGTGVLNVGPATLTTGNVFFVYRPGDFGSHVTSGGVCALSAGGNCQSDWTMDFSYRVTNLAFESEGFNAGDTLTVSAYDGASLVGTELVISNRAIDFGGLSFDRLVFDDSSTGAGFSFGDFSFDRAGNGRIPEPASLALFGLAALGAAAATRRRAR